MNQQQINQRLAEIEAELNLPSEASEKVFGGLRNAVSVIANALPKMKAASVPASSAALEAPSLFRSIAIKQWGGNEVEYMTDKGFGAVHIVSTFGELSDAIGEWVQEELS
jgi:hypothetical protein